LVFRYAIGTIEQNPGSRHLIKITDRNSQPYWDCLTCLSEELLNITSPEFNETILTETMWATYRCDYNQIVFSNNSSYFVQECLGPEVPIVVLAKTFPYVRLTILDGSPKLRRRLRKYSKPQEKSISVEIEFGYKAQVRLYLPAVLREYEDVTFPLILLV